MMQSLSGTRALSITFRTLHLGSFGILLGGHAFGIEADRLLSALYFTIGSGVGLLAMEIRATGLGWFFMGKGMQVLIKLAILMAVPFLWAYRVPLLLAIVVIASVGSHMPSRYRHYSFQYGGVVHGGNSAGRMPSKEEGTSGGAQAALIAALMDLRRAIERGWGVRQRNRPFKRR